MKRSSRAPTESFGCVMIHGFESERKVRCHKGAVDKPSNGAGATLVAILGQKMVLVNEAVLAEMKIGPVV